MKKNKKVIVIAGPTGSGESTITKKIIKICPSFKRLITATTRKPRLKERHGVDYYFLSKNKFKNEIKKGNILEHTCIKNRGIYYGTYKPDLNKKLKMGFTIITNPDIIGAKYFKKNYNALTIFVKPDSIKNIEKRLKHRDPDISANELKKRLVSAKKEIQKEKKFYDYVIVNRQGKLNQAVKEVLKIIKTHLNKD